ncbi:nitrate- and nitrite sensing domain-containing protein [Halioxenophilus sp. WMMB6]|uniref:nitrate- and nitrite sensing domain-containing protein n=1 Tax=Halioxenophilus sp. WMMB6 TaxID=3073815 RepID=UPI00295E49FD|nr:nitrate- and nitrite sensing domain-containing protein [Halioxenophilus sp. WMMB6]
MKAADFLIAAKRVEIESLRQLVDVCNLVTELGNLVHSLQRERGLTNVYLASGGERLADARLQQIAVSVACEQKLQGLLQLLGGAQWRGSARLLSAVAYVLQGLVELNGLRVKMNGCELAPAKATTAFGRLIAGLLSVVGEVADSAGDPALSRGLVSLLNLMQGKEYAGQERAWVSIGFAQGAFDDRLKERQAHLQAAQKHALEVFNQFAEADLGERWRQIEASQSALELNRLRALVGGLAAGQAIAPEISEVWYDLATQRIDAMRSLELEAVAALQALSGARLAVAESEFKERQALLARLQPAEEGAPLLLTDRPPVSMLLGELAGGLEVAESGLARSLFDVIQEQGQHLNRVRVELEEARQALSERKLVEQAKALLIKNLGLSEEMAYRKIQQRAMDSNLRLAEVSQILIDAAKATGAKKVQTKRR